MIVYVPKGMSTKFASCLYEIGRMASNTGKSNTIYTVTDCDHEYKSTNTWYHLDPFSGKVTTQQSITLPSTKYDIQNPIEVGDLKQAAEEVKRYILDNFEDDGADICWKVLSQN